MQQRPAPVQQLQGQLQQKLQGQLQEKLQGQPQEKLQGQPQEQRLGQVQQKRLRQLGHHSTARHLQQVDSELVVLSLCHMSALP